MKTFMWEEIKKYIVYNVAENLDSNLPDDKGRFEEYSKDGKKPWKFVCWSTPGYNLSSSQYTIKKCFDDDASLFSLWVIYKCQDGVYYRYRIEAKDEKSYNYLLGKN